MVANAPKLLNLGCGDQAHQEWMNVDFWPHRLRYRAPLAGRLFRRLDANRTHLAAAASPSASRPS